MAYPAYRKTPARMAALKRAQAASAAKRRGRGKGKLAVANRRNSRLEKGIKYAVIGAAAAGAIGGAVYVNHKTTQKFNAKVRAHTTARNVRIRDYSATRQAKMKFYNATRPRVASGRATRHNRVFVTTKHGTTSVRKRGH